MPLFISDEEFSRCSGDTATVAAKADAFIRGLLHDLDTVRARADAADINAEQNCSLIEQKYLSLAAEFAKFESQVSELQSSLDLQQRELAETQSQNHQARLQLVEKDREIESLRTDVGELRKSKRQLIELNEQKDLEISEKNATIKSYLDKIVHLTENAAHKEARLSEVEAELGRLRSACTRFQQALISAKDAAATNEEQLSAELSTVNKLNELYKESSEEWSRKATDLEGVIKAMELHLKQGDDVYKEKLEKELCARKQVEKEAADLKEKLEEREAEIQTRKKTNESNNLSLTSFTAHPWFSSIEVDNMVDENSAIVPKIPVGVSGTALAASLMRDGWSLAKMYAKYQEAIDALRHEQLGRKESEAILQRVLYELEEKAEAIGDERAEHEKMADAYSLMNQKLQNSLTENTYLEKTIQELKADLKRSERDYNLAQNEINDLQKQVTILLKECQDIQLRGGSIEYDIDDVTANITSTATTETEAEKVISEHLLTFKGINGLVEQNVQLRSLVRSLSCQIENQEVEFKEKLEMELTKHTEAASSKVEAVLQRAEEQGHMIESLHTSVAMYKRLYEEEHNKLPHSHSTEALAAVAEVGRIDLKASIESSQEAAKKSLEKVAERVKYLEDDLAKSRSEIIVLRSERDKMALEANFARERLESFMKEVEHQKAEVNGVLARNLEFSQLIVDYQQKLRESSESLSATEERCRKHSMELSVLKHEKEILSNAEKRASEEVHSLSERVQRLQASLGTIQSAEEVREEARASERTKHKEYVKKLENEWAEAKKELQEERENVRRLSLDHDQTLKNSLRQVEDMSKELTNALRAVTSADSRAAAAEAKLCSLQRKMSSTDDDKVVEMDGASGPSTLSSDEVVAELQAAREEIEKLKEEAHANKAHMLQYKGIAEVNEDALKQIEVAHENYKIESDKAKRALEAELHSLKERVSELENECSLKSEAVTSATAEKEEALASAFAEITNLKEEILSKSSQISEMEIQISGFKEHLDKEHQRWHTAQKNYERQVILQSETIQELTKTSAALALLHEEASELRKSSDAQKIENSELKAKWEEEKVALEKARSDAEKKYDEINEQNKILHSQLDALHIRWAEKERSYAGVSSGSSSADLFSDASLQNVINYLRRSKEIAETEVSLLKQEKLRLQSQLESALKAAESGHAKLEAERAKSKSFLFTEEEFKALQLQAQEMNLLRESNMQLREENKHNFEECQKSCELAQKARAEIENLENLLRQKEIELEGRKNEIEALKMEKDLLSHKVSELMERSKNVDVEDYDRVKKLVRDLQDKLRDKDTQIEEFAKIVSEKQVSVSRLEQDLSNCRLEFTEKEKRINDILHVEASLKLEAEKHRKLLAQFKKRIDVLSREKEELGKDNQQLARQLDEIKQAKRSNSDTTGERAIKEEKDTRIQILEKHLERLRDELKKEKEDNRVERSRRLKTEKAIKDSYNNVEQEKTKFINELERHKEALKRLSNEVEKLKIDLSILPEGMNAAQLFSESTVDDFVAPYISAVENFEKESQSIFSELGGRGNLGDTSTVPDSSAAATGSLVHAQPPGSTSLVAPGESSLPPKATGDSERRLALPRAGVEARKTGRRLVRPRLVKPDEPQGDAEMSDAEGPGGKSGPSGETETQSSAAQSSQPLARKRIAPTPSSELREESATLGEKSSDVVSPVLKKSKGSESPEVSAEEQPAATPEFTGSHPSTEESFDGGELPQGQNEEAGEAQNEDAEIAVERDEESKDPQHMDDASQEELHGDRTGILEENLDQPSETKVVTDDVQRDHSEPDNQQSTLAPGSEREEGEMFLDSGDLEGGSDLSNIAENQESREGQSEPAASPEPSPARVDDDALEAGEISPEHSMDDKIDEGDMVEEGVDVTDPTVVESDQVVDPAPVAGGSSLTGSAAETSSSKSNLSVPKQGTNYETEDTKQQQASPSMSTTINLSERARQRAQLREAGRGRGRASPRGRVLRGRGGQGGRRPPPSGNA
ncbi:unnamed protein product [Lupinus luteus]|uniref:Nucleoprotein TPR/MLP1 domain-containing protein n=1 Tax=Lupinus luteus TaxID=3873 RepID=A0AAV1XZG9_LUPLU